MNFTMQNIDSLKHALETVNEFCIHAGFKVNISKPECILLGPFKIYVNRNRRCNSHEQINKIKIFMKIMIKLNVIIKLDENYHDTDILFESRILEEKKINII